MSNVISWPRITKGGGQTHEDRKAWRQFQADMNHRRFELAMALARVRFDTPSAKLLREVARERWLAEVEHAE